MQAALRYVKRGALWATVLTPVCAGTAALIDGSFDGSLESWLSLWGTLFISFAFTIPVLARVLPFANQPLLRSGRAPERIGCAKNGTFTQPGPPRT